MVKSNKLIKISEINKKILDKLKIYPRETYNDVITKLIENKKCNK